MIVKELIDCLSKYPSDATVIYQRWSEQASMDADDIEHISAESKRIIERNSTYMHFYEDQWDYKRDGQPKFENVVMFPGN